MKPTRTIAFWNLMAFLLLQGAAAQAQDPDASSQVAGTLRNEEAGVAVVRRVTGEETAVPFGPQFHFRGAWNDGLGYRGHFFRADAMIPKHLDPGRSLFFVDISGGADEDGEGLASFGAAYRRYVESMNRIFTAGVYYDIDDGHREGYQQVGASFGALGRYIDARVNTYFVVNDPVHTLSTQNVGQPFFMGQTIGRMRREVLESAFSGVDLELSGPLPFLGRYGLNGGIGTYFLHSNADEDTLGLSLRLEALITEDVRLNLRHTNDDAFGRNTWLNLAWTLPDGVPSRWFRQPREVRDRLADPVRRDQRIHAKTRIDHERITLRDPQDDRPFRVIHVDPDAAAGGDGSFERPYNSMNLANANNTSRVDMVLVSPRDDDTGTNLALNSTFQLFDNQRLLGRTTRHTFATNQGTFDLPGFFSGPRPILSHSTGGDIVRLADNNEVSGFFFQGDSGTNGSAIVGTGITSFNINNNTDPEAAFGIDLVNATGTGLIVDNTIRDNTAGGVRITNTGGTLDLTVEGNTIRDNDGIGMDVSVAGGVLTGRLQENTIQENAGDGAAVTVDSSTLDFHTAAQDRNISGNAFNGNEGDGLEVNATAGSTVSLRLTDNTFGGLDQAAEPGNDEAGFRFAANSGTATVVVGGPDDEDGNQFILNETAGVLFDLTGDAEASLIARNNLLSVGGTGQVIRPGFMQNVFAANDDNSTGLVPIGFDANFFGTVFDELFVNNNGNVTFNNALGTFTPFPIVQNGIPMIAPFFGDVDTREGNEVTYGQGTVNGRPAFAVNYLDVRHFSVNGANNGLPTNTFQMVLIDRSDINPGDFDIEFNYEEIQWEAGEASGSDAFGLGGEAARVGFTNGVNTAFELPGSGVNGAFLDNGPASTSLIQNSRNSNLLGRYVFEARSGNVQVVPTGDVADGIQLNLSDNAQLQSSRIDENEIGQLSGNGVDVTANDNASVQELRIRDNTIENMGTSGIRATANDSSSIDLTEISGNTVASNGLHGVDVTADGGTVRGAITGNTVSTSDTGDGIAFAGTGGTINFGNAANGRLIADNEILGNADDGVSVDTTNATVDVLLQSNSIGDSDNPNGGFGINAAAEGGTLDVTVGGTDDDENVINSNGASGVGYFLNGTATGVLSVSNNRIGSNDDDGLNVQISDTAVSTQILVTDNQFASNAGDGLEFLRRDSAVFTDTQITSNTINGSGEDGVQITAQNADSTDFFDIEDNSITSSGGDGIGLMINADADLDVDITDNTIDGSAGDGIELTEASNSIFDSHSLTGAWTANTITNNQEHGIELSGLTSGLVIGSTGGDPDLGNTIDSNGMDGIEINGSGSATIGDNTITNSGSGGIDFNPATANTLTVVDNAIESNDGIGFSVTTSGDLGTTVTATGNTIANNTGDGLEIGASSDTTLTLTANNNEIDENDGRGIDILNQENADSTLTFTDNTITSNGMEGVYLVNTSSATQSQSVASSMALAADGAVDATPTIDLTFDNNMIDGNGTPGDPDLLSGTGLVMRIGTSDGGSSDFTDTGEFAGDGRGGVVASVTNNTFSGNFGDDVLIESFTSTVDPATTAGTWDDTTFDVTDYETDPLARLDLTFTGNTGDSLDVTRGQGDDGVGAFYENNEDVFKSRDVNQTDEGPFSDGTRRRNAQRLARRMDDGMLLPPSTPGGTSDTFLYPGLGQSTFRVDSSGNTFGAGTGFVLDNDPFDGVGFFNAGGQDSNGVDFTNPLVFPTGNAAFPGASGDGLQETPFGWSTLP